MSRLTRDMDSTTTSSRGLARRQGTIVNKYLEALEANKPKRGRKRTPESVQKRIDAIEAEMAEANPLRRLKLIQERLDRQADLANLAEIVDISDLEKGFVDVAASYGTSQGISYAAWKEMGVAPELLKQAGITRR